MFSNKSFYILALSAFIGLVLFESVASRPKNYCPNLKCKANANATLVQNGCADLAQYNFTDPFAASAINSTSCCNELTACYQHCTNPKHRCDEQFERCLKKVAKQNPSTPKTKGKKQHHSSEEIDDNDCALFESLRKQACIC